MYKLPKSFAQAHPHFQEKNAAVQTIPLRIEQRIGDGVHAIALACHALAGAGDSVATQVRAPSKPTWPGLMDNFVGGGLAAGLSVKENAIKEAKVKCKLVQC